MVRETSPYGQWMLPINFLPTETGGSCSPGCHKVATYTRTGGPEGIPPPPADDAPPAPGADEQPGGTTP